MMTITKADLVTSLVEVLTISKSDAKTLVDNFFNIISDTLANGEDVKISGFGNFTMRDKAPRPGRNPRTGEEVTISQRRVVTFKQGERLKRTELTKQVTTEEQVENIGA